MTGAARAWRLVLVSVGCVAVGALCGACAERQSHSQYQASLRGPINERARIFDELPGHDPADVKYYDTAYRTVRRSADDLEAIDPPSGAETAHKRHVEGLRGLASLLTKFADCARLFARDAGAGRQCREGLDQLELDEVRNDLDEADTIYRQEGFKVDPQGG